MKGGAPAAAPLTAARGEVRASSRTACPVPLCANCSRWLRWTRGSLGQRMARDTFRRALRRLGLHDRISRPLAGDRVGMAMDDLPAVLFATEDVRDPERTRGRDVSATHLHPASLDRQLVSEIRGRVGRDAFDAES